MDDFDRRFGGMARLYGRAGLERLRRAHVCVIGLGGVGSWTVEALARSGVGALTLVDLDELCISNVNRQLPALTETIGQPKATVLAARVTGINAACRVDARLAFFTEDTAAELLAPRPDCVVDAIDVVRNKVFLIQWCREAGLPLVTCGGAGGRRSPTEVRIADLADVNYDRLMSGVRKRLRQDHDFPRTGRKMGVPCVYSPELPVVPQADGSVCELPAAEGVDEPGTRRLNCDNGYGSATFVTGAFGFAAAAWVVNHLAGAEPTTR